MRNLLSFKSILSQTLSLSLIFSIFTLSIPAAPQSIKESRGKVIGFMLGSQSWFDSIRTGITEYFSKPEIKNQETQELRSSEVTELKIKFPDSAFVGQVIQLDAVPYDINNIPVAGVALKWEVEKPNGEIESDLSGIYDLKETGNYKVTVVGAGKTESHVISVVENNAVDVSEKQESKTNQTDANLLPFEDWNSNNIEFGRLPRNNKGDTPGVPKENSNFNITAPVLSMTGRAGLDLNLNLSYNSRVWTKMGTDISYDMDKDTPAPGWTLGFGKILNFPSVNASQSRIVQLNADGSKRYFNGSLKVENYQTILEGQSTDGSYIKSRTVSPANVVNGQACFHKNDYTFLKYSDGTTIGYSNFDQYTSSPCVTAGASYTQVPYYIMDRNGNYITIAYHWGSQDGRFIDYIKDTLGRVFTFNYTQINGKYYLTSITGAGLRDENNVVHSRTFLQLEYKDHTLGYNFNGLNPKVRDDNNSIKVLSSIYYPATKSGYWFGDSDSYSPYGMIRKVEERKDTNGTGTISNGDVTRRRVYSYPENTTTAITDVPEFQTVTETWDGMPDPNQPAVTQYVVNWNTSPRTTTIISPYQEGKTVEYSFNTTNSNNTADKAKDGVTYKTEFYDKNNVLRAVDETSWGTGTLSFSAHSGAGSYSLTVLRPAEITHTEINNSVALTKKSVYETYGQYNRVEAMKEIGFNGETLRRTTTSYINKNDNPQTVNDWYKPRVINLPNIVQVFDGDGNRIDYTEYRYDMVPMTRPFVSELIGIPQFVGGYCTSQCNPEVSEERGYLSNVIKYNKVTNSSLDGAQVDGRYYMTTGYVNNYSPSQLAVNFSFSNFDSSTAFAYPSIVSQGSSGFANQKIDNSFTYDLNTGLPLSMTDENQQTTNFEYDLETWRLKKVISPTGAYSINSFDDINRIYTQTAYTSDNQLAEKQITKVNGLGLTYRQESLEKIETGQEIFSVVETVYDKLGKVQKTSNPFRSNEQAHGTAWSEAFYDELGRVEKTKSADGSEKYNYYDETSRPNVASNALGRTYRIKDPIGREKWYRTDTEGNVAEVVEPDPDGNGSVNSNGLLTKFYYDKLGRLTKTEQGNQERKFRYDSLGRLTHQKMVETQATLNDEGVFVGPSSGIWSDYFVYDELSNVVSITDARGVKTNYSYFDSSLGYRDQLDRIRSISYDVTNAPNVLAAPTTKFEYQLSGNIGKVKSIFTEQVVNGNVQRQVTNDLSYDRFGRVTENKTVLASRSNFPMIVNYSYDSLSRIKEIKYPSQYGMNDVNSGNPVRKTIQNEYENTGRMKNLKVDNQEYASNFIFNNFDQVTSLKIGPSGANQIIEQYNFDPLNGNLLNQKVVRAGESLLDLSYQYQQCSCSTGGSGQITAITNNLDRNRDRGYEYDKLGRLKKVTGGVNQTWAQIYGYDRFGNRKTVESLGVEALRMQEQAVNNKREQNKLLGDIIPNGAFISKDKLLENVKNLTLVNSERKTSNEVIDSYKKELDAQNTENANNANNTKQISTTLLTTPGKPFDFDGDGKADVSTWQRSAGTWTINNSQVGQTSSQLGTAGNQIAPADYDGDGKTDKAVFNPTTGSWTIYQSSNSTTVTKTWGQKGDAIVPADYDGDGKADIAVWRPSSGDWLITKSSNNSWYSINFGGQRFGDIPIVGDYDGDGRSDIAVWRPNGGNWYVFVLSSSNSQVLSFAWGTIGDVPVPSDYDGDHKTDLAVWRPSTGYWYILQSSNGQLTSTLFGGLQLGDIPVSADYDGDGKEDIAVWRPSTGNWYIIQSSTGQTVSASLGSNSEIAVPSAYRRRSSAPTNQNKQIPRDGFENLSFDPLTNRIDTTGFEYDYAGNQTRIVKTDGTILRFQYDASGRLIKVKNDNQQTLTTYTYGIGRDRLVSQDGDETSSNLTYYAWEGESVVGEYLEGPTNTLVWMKNYIYLAGSLIATQVKDGSSEVVQFHHSDQLGTRMVTNPATGTYFEQNSLPFGTSLDSESTGATNRRFTSYDRSASTGLDYATNRFYDSSQGRFTTVDPIKTSSMSMLNPQTFNLYAYTANDPVNRMDPSGLDWTTGNNTITLTTFPFPTMGGIGTSQQTGWQQFLTGLLGSLLGGGRDYAGAFVGGFTWRELADASRIKPTQPPPLPGAGTISSFNSDKDWSKKIKDKDVREFFNKNPFCLTALSEIIGADFKSFIKSLNKFKYIDLRKKTDSFLDKSLTKLQIPEIADDGTFSELSGTLRTYDYAIAITSPNKNRAYLYKNHFNQSLVEQGATKVHEFFHKYFRANHVGILEKLKLPKAEESKIKAFELGGKLYPETTLPRDVNAGINLNAWLSGNCQSN